MRPRLLLPGLALLFAVQPLAHAGVSVSFQEDACPFLKNDPGLLDLLQKTMDIEAVGWSPNNGRSFTHLAGDRTLPYGFRAKPKGQSGAYTVLVLIQQNESGDGVQLTIVPVNKADATGTTAPATVPIPSN
jgi:hypothetical protein